MTYDVDSLNRLLGEYLLTKNEPNRFFIDTKIAADFKPAEVAAKVANSQCEYSNHNSDTQCSQFTYFLFD